MTTTHTFKGNLMATKLRNKKIQALLLKIKKILEEQKVQGITIDETKDLITINNTQWPQKLTFDQQLIKTAQLTDSTTYTLQDIALHDSNGIASDETIAQAVTLQTAVTKL